MAKYAKSVITLIQGNSCALCWANNVHIATDVFLGVSNNVTKNVEQQQLQTNFGNRENEM